APSFTLLVFRRVGLVRELVVARSIIDPRGAFAVQVTQGDYELIASAAGWAPSPATHATAGTTDLQLALGHGATLRGKVIASDLHTPIAHARILREAVTGGASAQPANTGTVTGDDGTFELTGIPAGPVSITIGADDFHPKIEAGMTASDGGTIGPVTIALDRLLPGDAPTVELVGIGVVLAADAESLIVKTVFAGGGADLAGITEGERVLAVDGQPVLPLGIDGTITKIRGVEGTTLVLTVLRDGQPVPVVVQRRRLKA
ncbi:MAG TPA: carboxypeptidase regulatory-like domain-containing protein, partial [Kofleriaceae bacterium]|nr:carboxypeptidase regulatory-like domain-containing protein [Kofleriaceae bacterium]